MSNRAVKQLMIELYEDADCFTYPSNKRIYQMVLHNNTSPEALIESLRFSSVQQVATELHRCHPVAHERRDRQCQKGGISGPKAGHKQFM